MKEGQGTEIGHKHFQHPGRTEKNFGLTMDRFSFIVLDVSLQALQVDPSLHRRFREGGQAIIFKGNDFVDPASSEVFKILNGMPALRESAIKLASICASPIQSVPTLSDFGAGRNIPVPSARSISVSITPPAPQAYIGAFPVVDAKEFSTVLRCVGDKVELVGKVVSVKEGIGKRGRGRGKPYVFVNFGPWNGQSAKITIWSEGLGNLSARPNQSWVGRWISVTGLVEPPYEGKHYGKPYRNVGITVVSDNQIVHLQEHDAAFRLGGRTAGGDSSGSRPSNAEILRNLQRGGERIAPKGGFVPPSPAPQPPRSKNEQILAGIRATQSTGHLGQTAASRPAQPMPASKIGLFSRVPGWIWIVGFLIIVFALSR